MGEMLAGMAAIVAALVATGFTVHIVRKRNNRSVKQKAKGHGVNIEGGVKGGFDYRPKR